MLKYLTQIWNSPDLRKKILFTLAILIIYRFLAHITVPGADIEALQAMSQQSSDLLDMFSLLTGGGTENFSIVLMGISPYINASIIIQLLTVVIPRLENLSKEGEQGRKKINSYTRWLTLPLAFLQSYGMILLLNSQAQIPIIADINNPGVILPAMLTITAGTILLVWLGEQITEKGIGNGISLIIFASILARVPTMVGKSLYLAQDDETKLMPFILMVLVTLILLVIVVLFTEAERRIPLTYAGRGVKAKTEQAYLPMKINQAGMIPIIFAVALISFPGILGSFLASAKSESLQTFGSTVTALFQAGTTLYLLFYFLLVIGFTYFYVSITFNPVQVAENIQKRGGYIPGIRPGKQTSEYLGKVSKRLTLFGALFLAFIAISPMAIQIIFQSAAIGSVPLLISGAGIIIIVGVVLELIRQINAQLIMHDYSKFY
ncbi:preprotein translocase subunit SecY [Candidatus Peregrinibacteria bacterium]|nr:preprotein translocase subunit SecY [Candidatus Peregrinibacteria bacterium]